MSPARWDVQEFIALGLVALAALHLLGRLRRLLAPPDPSRSNAPACGGCSGGGCGAAAAQPNAAPRKTEAPLVVLEPPPRPSRPPRDPRANGEPRPTGAPR